VRQFLPSSHPESVAGIERELDLLGSEITIVVEPDKLLRRGAQSRSRREAFKEEARKDVELFGRKKFDDPCPVAVALDIHVPEGRRQQPQMSDVVKAYLDALEGIAYDDDRQIEHLVVHRRGTDHPMLSSLEPRDESRNGVVMLVIQPLEAYTKLYDRTFRRTIFRRGGHSPFHSAWHARDEMALAKVKVERRLIRDVHDAGPTEAVIASYEEQRLTGSPLADVDRPGPLSTDMQRAFRVFPAHRVHSALRGVHGSRFMLPLRGDGAGSNSIWDEEVDRVLEGHRRHRLMTRAPLRTFVALDIAVRGKSVHGKDLDNLARLIIPRFENAFCVQRGTVACYRAYQAIGSPSGIQVRILSDVRMLGLEIALGDTRRVLADTVSSARQ
jgi:Holliday junction resolvase RusA-like endonuclease